MAQKYLEDELEKYFNKKLDELEIFHCKGMSRGRKGFPDREIYYDRIYRVELKVGKKGGSYYKQQPMQIWWMNKIRASGGNYTLVVGYEGVDKFIELLKERSWMV